MLGLRSVLPCAGESCIQQLSVEQHSILCHWSISVLARDRFMAVDREDERRRVGLCLDCENARVIETPRSSKFYQCQLSFHDPSFPKYPRLPVVECAGYVRKGLPS
jgi:hypothetical protein